MKAKFALTITMVVIFFSAKSQVSTTTLAGDYKIINIGDDTYGDYTRAVILLHEIYNGTLIDHNYAIGTITAMRGAAGGYNRLNVVNLTTSSAYNGISGTITSNDDNAVWALKTCMYNGKKYLAVDIPYSAAFHNWGYYFSGSTSSTGENMKCVPYEVNGAPVNTTLINNIQDFNSNMVETHNIAGLNITGNVGIGTNDPGSYKLAVNGTIHSKAVVVDLIEWPDFVFKRDYKLMPLSQVKSFIDQNMHLPDVPTATTIEKDGVNLGEMNKALLKKVEELTLYLIEKDKQINGLKSSQDKLQIEVQYLMNKIKQ